MNTSEALNDIQNLIVNYIKDKYRYGAVGTGDELPSKDDISLYSEVYRKELAGTEIVGGNKIRFSFFLDASEANGYTLKEFGIFDSNEGGMMLCREMIDYLKTADVELWFELEEKIEVSG